MKKLRFTEEQITYALRLADSGKPLVDVCRQVGVSEATFYPWKKKYADLGVSELRKLKQRPIPVLHEVRSALYRCRIQSHVEPRTGEMGGIWR